MSESMCCTQLYNEIGDLPLLNSCLKKTENQYVALFFLPLSHAVCDAAEIKCQKD